MGLDTTQPSLLSRVRNPSDRDAWREFEAKYRDLVLRYCRRRGLQQSDAEDVRQVVMLNLARALPRFRYCPERGRFRSYLGIVVRNAISTCLSRPKGSDTPLDNIELSHIAAPTPPADPGWEQEWTNHHYRLAMCTIRQTFDSRSVQAFDRLLAGDAVEHVAEHFGMSTQAVHKVKQRIRERLKDLIAEQIQEEDMPVSQKDSRA